jgi:hypothetical protein
VLVVVVGGAHAAADGKQDALLRNLESGAARRKINSRLNNKNYFEDVIESKETLN